MTRKAIAYYRVSTDRQGKSGLGLEAQQEAVGRFAAHDGFQVVAEYTEIESGKKNQRPQLLAALAQCRKEKAALIIAKLDRLGRNVAFIANLMQSGVEFKAVDNPHANRLMIHMLAAFAEHEREMISARTKDALQAAKRRGVALGKYGQVVGGQNRQDSDRRAAELRPLIEQLQRDGFKTVRAIRDELNRREIVTARSTSKGWQIQTVHDLLKRIEQLEHKRSTPQINAVS